MSINLPDQETRNQYLATGTQDTFTYTFKAFEADNISVYVTLQGNAPDPETDIKILTTDYTVTNVGENSGGTVVFVAGKLPPASSTVTIVREIPASIISTFSDPQTFNGENLDTQLERLTALIQQNKTALDFNSLKYAINAILENNTESILPTLMNGQIWKKINDVIIGVIPKDSDTTLRSELESEVVGADGASLVGYNDDGVQKTVKEKLDELSIKSIIDITYPVGSAFLDAVGTLTPPGQGIGGIVWQEQTSAEGHILMGHSTTGDWPVDAGMAAGFTQTANAMTDANLKSHTHLLVRDSNSESTLTPEAHIAQSRTSDATYNLAGLPSAPNSAPSGIAGSSSPTPIGLTGLQRYGVVVWKRTA